MQNILWSSDLEIHHPKIDAQHQELFARIGKLLEACNSGKGREVITETLQFLENYVVEHFGMEEQLMLKSGYPKYLQHKAAHTGFIASFTDLKKQIDPNGPGVNIVILTNHLVVEWLNQHIRNVDKQFAQYLRERK